MRLVLGALVFACLSAANVASAQVSADLAALARKRDVPTSEVLASLDRMGAALDAAPPALRRDAQALRAAVLIERGQFRAASETLAQLIATAESVSDPAMLAQALVLKARLAYYRRQPEQLYESARRAVAVAEPLQSPALLAAAQQSLSLAYMRLGRTDDAVRLAHAAHESASKTGDGRLKATVLKTLGVIQTYVPDLARSRAYAEDALRLAEASGDQWLICEIEILRSIISGPMDDGTSDLPLLIRANALAARMELAYDEEISLVNLSDWHITKREWAQAIEVARRGLVVAARFDEPEHSGLIRMNLGLALLGAGRGPEGVAELERAVLVFRHSGEGVYLANAIHALANGYERTGRLKEAVAAFRDYRVVRDQNEALARSRLLAEMQERFDTERRQNEIAALREANQRQADAAEAQRQRTMFWIMVAAIAVVAGALVFHLARRTHRANLALSAANRQLAHLAERDSLTGLLNRRAMHGWIETQLMADTTASGALMLLDIDHFKQVNDRLGHGVGDEVIVEFAQRIATLLRDGDRLARWGGEEFLVALRGVAPHQLPALAQRILRSISDSAFMTAAGPVPVTASMGYLPLPLTPESHAEGWEFHLAIADQALFRAKANGRNMAFGLVAAVSPWAELRRPLTEQFDTAIATGMVVGDTCRGGRSLIDKIVPFGVRT
ncbi:GGDEF domain-containing protein [Niveibacterium sp. 24ML]|uniref:tetratricopeptide repeat-containing diguanylate cyclase n=1 Tax=Niveibacterium sp. 24ML TaxID=2985512 RepID=UPI002271AA09|nr:GGDEF domain-containing protein [Niveibacterium sp. 24ML]MCX9155999.1 GGDEF domain-containing protein [Niveibacterium sp. 24ML]